MSHGHKHKMRKRVTAPKRSSSKKRVTKKSKKLSLPVSLTFNAAPLGNNKTATLFYNALSSFSTGALGAPQVKVWQCNSMFDPDFTGGGHQPMGFDQMMVFFSRYIVIRSNIEVQFQNLSDNLLTVGICLKTESTAEVDYRIYGENQPNRQALIGAAGSSSDKVTLALPFDTASFFGKKDVKDETDLSGSASSSPVSNAFWHTYADGTPQGNSGKAVTAMVKITMEGYFYDPQTQGIN